MVVDGRSMKILNATCICILAICYIGNTMIDIKRTRLSVKCPEPNNTCISRVRRSLTISKCV